MVQEVGRRGGASRPWRRSSSEAAARVAEQAARAHLAGNAGAEAEDAAREEIFLEGIFVENQETIYENKLTGDALSERHGKQVRTGR